MYQQRQSYVFARKLVVMDMRNSKLSIVWSWKKNEDIVDHNETRYLYEYFKRVDTDDFDEQLDEIAQVITSKPKLIFMGIGTSGALCKYAARYFLNIGKFSQHIDDPFYPVPADFSEDSVIFVLSVSGETKETIDQIKTV
ncbi:DNA-binding MurR/RpiR family transcriptional regulator [Breznakia sp. PH1-1]|nr:DNA-binding MurR/RpiR family transcriptional regulator [Breznakia sp. PH1-1]MDH6405185.1 DNA-binding MurR/RpiR family transcriptional regulator [Breznakia sp. PF1-11]MDH6412911.1 DNA-binding MurR/RpiR family transcriptional regulator [Breznakia sp. PFB1-11]MDH6415273.1 DNA-binding MurR/RpiR family transcriptional regulator [Breznakia sp. PFB1-14]MDH6417582.1 DNA-binding MurR/RpiR family transcriptional regulator [Breznakia sp. PFB1-4]MDH6419932.1 DNA-binding MurR/RpiR family transcriptional